MSKQSNMITLYTTSTELTAVLAATHVYLDLLEVVEPLEQDRKRQEAIQQLLAFQNRCQGMNARVEEPVDTLFLLQVPFHELMVVTKAVEAYEFMDKVDCLPTHTSGLTSTEVMTLTRSFQRRMISNPPKS